MKRHAHRRVGKRRLGRRLGAPLLLGPLLLAPLACSGPLDNDDLPPNVSDPATVQTPAGAVAAYRGALAVFRDAVNNALVMGGLLTDELTVLTTPPEYRGPYNIFNERTLPLDASEIVPAYAALHQARQQARLARGFLRAYAPESSPALAGQLYAAEGYAEIYLADLYCSGMPLNTLDFGEDFTLTAGFSTAGVYEHAAMLFDSALAMAADSERVQHWAALGRARALLGLGRYGEAAAAVAVVTDEYQYAVSFDPTATGQSEVNPGQLLFWRYDVALIAGSPSQAARPTMADQEGVNGLDYGTSGDPRTASQVARQNFFGAPFIYPTKYYTVMTDPVAVVVASGIEARLIEAEAALQAGDVPTWLTKLNTLRQTAIPDVVLPDYDDPGTTAGRVDLMFRERAFWLFLTGHRQGDLRRLIRQYQRSPNAVYPTGPASGATGSYGSDVTVPVPPVEQELNSRYTGCLHRNA